MERERVRNGKTETETVARPGYVHSLVSICRHLRRDVGQDLSIFTQHYFHVTSANTGKFLCGLKF